MAAILFWGHGKTRKCTIGMPTDQAIARRSASSIKGRPPISASRISRADIPANGRQEAVADARTEPSATPNDVIPARSISVSPLRCLNLAISLQTNLGTCASSRSECGSKPSFRDSENRSSALAEADASASSLHHVGQAASMAGLLSPMPWRRCFSRAAFSFSREVPPFSGFGWDLRTKVLTIHDSCTIHAVPRSTPKRNPVASRLRLKDNSASMKAGS